jgi:hypothetical protein
MLDIDSYLRSKGLPTWNTDEAKSLAKAINVKASEFVESYSASPDYKALAQSTTKNTALGYFYAAATLALAKKGAITACQKHNPGHTCKVVDPPESAPTPPAPTPASVPNKPDGQDTTMSMEVRSNEEAVPTIAGK